MTVLKGAAAERFLARPDPEIKAALLYGQDEGRVQEAARTLVKAVAGALDDPFRVSRLSDDQLADDPALLIDEALALSMTGGRRAVWVRGAGPGFQRAVEAWLAHPKGDTLVVAEAGNLPKTAKLRQLMEKSRQAAVFAGYEDSPEDLERLALAAAKAEGLSFEDDALTRLVGLIGADRALSRGEIEKLMLYCRDGERISLAHVEAACGDAAALSAEEAADAALEGDAGAALAEFDRLVASGMAPERVVALCQAALMRLIALRAQIDSGRDRETVLRGARPAIYFKRLARVSRQLARWDRDSLMEAARTLADAVHRSRTLPALEPAFAERALMTLARKARNLARA